MSTWINEKVTAVPEEPTLPEPPEPPLPASQAEVPSSSGDVSQPPQRCEYSAEERDSRIAELERIAQADVDRRFGPKSWRAVFTPADKLRRYKKGRLKKGTRKPRHNVFGPHIRCYTIDVRLPGDVQDDFLRSIDEACCRKGARILLLGQAPTEANACGCRHVCCEGGGWSSRQKVGKKWVSMAPVACSCAGGLGGAEASAHDGAAEAEIGMGAEGEGEGEDAAVMQCEEEEGESEGEEGEGEEGEGEEGEGEEGEGRRARARRARVRRARARVRRARARVRRARPRVRRAKARARAGAQALVQKRRAPPVTMAASMTSTTRISSVMCLRMRWRPHSTRSISQSDASDVRHASQES